LLADVELRVTANVNVFDLVIGYLQFD